MPDDETPRVEPAAEPAEPAAPNPLDALVAELRAENAQSRAQIAALNDTVQAALSPRAVSTPGGDASGITPQLRQALRNKGLSDADITHNAPLILPFVEIFAPELAALVESRVGGVDERLTMREMLDDTESFPDAKVLRKEIKQIADEAKKAGRPLSLEAAYHTARSLNMDKVREAESQRRAESRSADASALGGLGHRASSGQAARAGRADIPRTKADLDSMSREERMKFYEKYGDVPVQ